MYDLAGLPFGRGRFPFFLRADIRGAWRPFSRGRRWSHPRSEISVSELLFRNKISPPLPNSRSIIYRQRGRFLLALLYFPLVGSELGSGIPKNTGRTTQNTKSLAGWVVCPGVVGPSALSRRERTAERCLRWRRTRSLTVELLSALTAKQAQDRRPALRVLRNLRERMSSSSQSV